MSTAARIGPRRGRTQHLLQIVARRARWIPVAFAAAYGLLLLVYMPAIVRGAWGISDGDIDGVLARLDLTGHSGWLSTGDFSHYQTMAFALLTRSLPFYRALWEVTPVACLAFGLVAFWWCAYRAFGLWPAALASGVLLCLGYNGISMAVAFDAHSNTAVTAVMCAVGCIWVLPRVAEISMGKIAAVALVVGILGGLVLAGDALFLGWGLLPVLLATALAAWRAPSRDLPRILLFGVGVLLATAASAGLFAAIMHAARVTSNVGPNQTLSTFFTGAGLVTNVETFVNSVPWEMTGTFGGRPPGFETIRLFLCTMLLLAAGISVIWLLRRELYRGSLKRVPGGVPVTAAFVHVVFWASALVGAIALFIVGSPAAAPQSGRYLLGAYVALAALVPVLLSRGVVLRVITASGVGLFCLGAILQLLSVAPRVPSTKMAVALERYARQNHVAVAYSYYWDSLDTTWATDFRLDVFPVQNCPEGTPTNSRGVFPLVCAYDGLANSHWYQPRAGRRTMLVLEPQASNVVAPSALTADLGKPLTTAKVGGRTVLVYRYDIAARMPASY